MKGKLLQDFFAVLSLIADVLTISHDDRAHILVVALAVVIAYFLYRLLVKKQKNKDKE